MPLIPGHKLGPYEIVSPLGAGGMGEVYRARDTRLERTVAIKILPAHFSSDPVRKQRFEREAKTISSLNHPNVCTLHDIGSQDGMDYLVMECVEGETLAKRLEKGPLPLEQVLRFGAQIADALDKAHRSGLVHRDLKPGNIMLTTAGAKLLDFGLAKPAVTLTTTATLTITTLSSPVTEQGTIVGTYQYMSPEQVEGKEVDGRSDIFSLGAVLYEMVTGKKAFEGKSQLSLASAILDKEPVLISTSKPMTPLAMDHAVKKCLAKDPDERWQSGSDLKSELNWIAESGSHGDMAAPALALRRKRERLGWAAAAVLALVAVVFGALLLWNKFVANPTGVTMPVVRFDISLSVAQSSAFSFLTLDRGVTISPDGKRFVFRVLDGSVIRLMLRNIEASEMSTIPGTDNALNALFSPDSQSVAFFAAGKLKRVSLAGDSPSTICDAQNLQGSGTWGADGYIYFSSGGDTAGLWRVPAEGGTPQRIGTPAADALVEFSPTVLPGGEAILEALWDGKSFDSWRIDSIRVATGERRTVVRNAFGPRFVSPGVLLFMRSNSLFAVPFDARRLEARGTPLSVVEGVVGVPAYGVGQYDVSDNGDLVYVGTGSALNNHLVWRERDGKAHEVALPPNTYQAPRISPDGKDIALTVRNPDPDIWIYNILRGTLRRVSFAPGEDEVPAWSPDGKRVAYSSNSRGQLSWVSANGSAGEEVLAPMQSHAHIGTWSRDGKVVVYEAFSKTTNRAIWVLPLEGDRKPHCYICNNFDNRSPALSPDGHWLAYQSDESGRPEVYVQRFPGPGEKTQISREGGHFPVWAKNGAELFFRNYDKQFVVSISTKDGLTVGNPQFLFENAGWAWFAGPQYDVTPDGKRMIEVEVGKETIASPLHVVLNWKSELFQHLAAQKR